MAKRMVLMLGVVGVLLTALGFIKFRQVQSAAQTSAFQPPPEAVTSVVAEREQWPATMTVIGTMEAVQGVMISADLPGTVERITFDSGKFVREGEVLVGLDTRQERAQLAALEAQRDLARVNFGRMQQLVDEGVISRMEYDQASAQQRATEANVAEIHATIARKTIRAPF
jgi:membrane fusion protein (multidrug efflux system)